MLPLPIPDPDWPAKLFFRKIYDTMEHGALWKALGDQGVPRAYVRVCRALYKKQQAVVKTQVDSRHFDISRGTKQGDPMSPKLFNAVLQKVFGTESPCRCADNIC